MANMVQIIVLAGGQGKRMKSELPKVLVLFRGRPMIANLLESIKQSNICLRPIIIIGFHGDRVKQALGPNYDYIVQSEQLGTGHAVACAKPLLLGKSDDIMVLYGDHPLVSAETIRRVAAAHVEAGTVMTMAVIAVEDFNDWRQPLMQFGKIIRGADGQVKAIVEVKDCTEDQKKIKEVNPSYFCFKAGWLWDNINKLKNDNAQKEYYLTDMAALAISQGERIAEVPVAALEALGINTREQLEILEQI